MRNKVDCYTFENEYGTAELQLWHCHGTGEKNGGLIAIAPHFYELIVEGLSVTGETATILLFSSEREYEAKNRFQLLKLAWEGKVLSY